VPGTPPARLLPSQCHQSSADYEWRGAFNRDIHHTPRIVSGHPGHPRPLYIFRPPGHFHLMMLRLSCGVKSQVGGEVEGEVKWDRGCHIPQRKGLRMYRPIRHGCAFERFGLFKLFISNIKWKKFSITKVCLDKFSLGKISHMEVCSCKFGTCEVCSD
jgi:hypothetical protein